MRRIGLLIPFLLLATTALAGSGAPAAGTSLAPVPRQVLIARTVVSVMQGKHYPDMPLDAHLSHAILDQYFDDLDPGRFFFTQADIDRFHKYDDQLAADLKHGNLEPAYAIYRFYIAQVKRRIKYALKLLDKEPSLTGKDSYRYARRHAPWAKSDQALDALWRARVTNDTLTLLLTGKSWKDTRTVLEKRYKYALDDAEKANSNDVFDAFMNAYTEAQDPHSAYFSPFQAQQFQIEMSLQFEGIGAELTERDGYPTVVRILPGGPAAKNGELKPGDRIVGVAEGRSAKFTDVVGWRLDDVVKKIRGPKGSTVRLQILPAGAMPGSAQKTLDLVRNTVELEAERAHAKTMFVKEGKSGYRIGVIDIPSFYANFSEDGNDNSPTVTGDVAALIKELKKDKVSGILLDLRNNGGGSLEEARSLTGLFIPGGPVVQVQERGGRTQVLATPRGETQAWTGPLAVLVNRFSASATEIFAGALKDYHRALVLGSTTWGKGTVQQLIDLNGYLPGFKPGELKFTTAQFFRVDGSSTQLKGVSPDIAFPSAIDDSQFGEGSYPNPLPWKEIKPAQYSPVDDGVAAALPKLADYFDSVIKTEPRFQLYERQISQQLAAASRTSVSLSYAARKAERDTQRSRELAFDNAWRKLGGKPPFKTLKAADASEFSPPDIGLRAAARLLGRYIAVAPSDLPASFRAVIKPTAIATQDCLRWGHGSTIVHGCPPAPGTAAAAATGHAPASASGG